MTKIVYNACYGGFSLSDEAIAMYLDLKGYTYTSKKHGLVTMFAVEGWENFRRGDIERTDLVLVKVIETLGVKANGDFSNLVIKDLPKGTRYRITEYDGYESIQIADDIDWCIA